MRRSSLSSLTNVSQPHRLAMEAEHRGDLVTAAQWFREEAIEAGNTGQVQVELLAWSNLAEMLVRSGQPHEAIEVATRLLAKARQEQLQIYEMRATGRLVEALLSIDPRGRWSEVTVLLENGLKLARQAAVNYWEVYSLVLMANGAIAVRDLDSAYRWLQEANNCLHTETFDWSHLQAYIWCSLALLMVRREDFSDARHYAEQAVGVAREDGVLDFVAQAELVLAQVERSQGEHAEALRLAEKVRSQAIRLKWKGIEQVAECLRGVLARDLGYLEISDEAAQRALTLAYELKAKEKQVESLLTWGETLLVLGRKIEAHDVLRQARRLSQEQDYEDHFLRADELLARTL